MKNKLFRLFSIEREKNKKHIIIYAAVSAVLAIISMIIGVGVWVSLGGGIALMGILLFRFRLDDSAPVLLRFAVLFIFTLFIFLCMQVTISCGFILITPIKFIMNLVLLQGLSSLFWMVTGSIKISITSVGVFCYIVAIADHLVVQARSFEIQFSDLSSLGTAAEVAGGYSFSLSVVTKIGIILGVCLITFVIRAHFPSHERSMVRTGISLLSIAATVLCAITIYTQVGSSVIGYQDKYWKYRGSERNGFWVNIIYSASATRIKTLDNYNPETLEEEVAEYTADVEKTETKKGKKPNVIVVMNETFCDVQNVAEYMGVNLKTNVPVTPFIDSLSNYSSNVIKGHALSSVYGGNTANSELEFLTQMSIQFIPRNTVAYNLYMKEDNSFSIVNLFNEAGYKTVGIHPENKTNWQRDRIYSYYGFDETYFADSFTDLTEEDYYRGHISDAAAYDKVCEIFENKEDDESIFTFLITMQNHGGYIGTGFDAEDYTVNAEGFENYMSVREYLACIHNADEAFKNFTEYFKNYDEDTIILFYGDHQPSLSNIPLKFFGIDDDSTTERQEAKYVVPYVFWANYDIECERATQLTSINYLSSWLLDIVGIKGTPFTDFVKKTNEEIMAINSLGYFDKYYNFYETDYNNQNYNEALNLYSRLQYNAMFDDENKIIKLFK